MNVSDQRSDQTLPVPRFCLILQPEFPVNALILASEALRIASQNSGRTLFEYCYVSQTGEPVRASNGMWLTVDHSLADMPAADYYFVFEGNLPTQKNSPQLLAKLREVRRAGATLAGIDTGAFALAQAGLIKDSVVVHWEAASTFHERFAQLPTSDSLYLLEGHTLSCAGGVATLDLMLELIRRRYGATLASEVANALVHQPREGWQPQRADTPEISQARSLSDRLLTLMESNLDFPLSAAEIARRLGISARTLDRHCKRQFGQTPMQLYLGIRLQAARNFLFYEDYSIKEVALAYGFSSPAVFSRTFRVYFGQTPTAFRRSIRDQQSQTRLPEIRRLYSMRS
jgi:AraC family carnitine catabolism transcriptional activator